MPGEKILFREVKKRRGRVVDAVIIIGQFQAREEAPDKGGFSGAFIADYTYEQVC